MQCYIDILHAKENICSPIVFFITPIPSTALPLCNISTKSLIGFEFPECIAVLAAGDIGAKYEFESPAGGILTLGSSLSFIISCKSCRDKRRLSVSCLFCCIIVVDGGGVFSRLKNCVKRDEADVASPSPPTPF